MKVGSLFSGIGGLELGLERAGMIVRWQVERDPFCRKVLAKHWPNIPRFDDVCTVGPHNLEPVDLICGGFPCQDISHAGRQLGIAEGTRSGLWHEYVRILREIRPRFVVVENVSALLVRGLDVVLGELSELGYDAEWSLVSACALGAPHPRERVFIVAHTREVRFHPRRPEQSLPGHRMDGKDGALARRPGGSWPAEPGLSRVAHGVPDRVERIAGYGNAVVPCVAELIGGWIVESARQTMADDSIRRGAA